MRRAIPLVLLLIGVLQPALGRTKTPGDPWERTNRRIFALNQVLDRKIIGPLSRFTSGLTPGPIGRMIHNFLVNLNEPVVIANDLLQVRPGPAIRSAFRLVVNTTAGGLGAIDVAKALGDPMHVNGFGDTLGRWGVHSGPYIVIPVFGPSSVRDLFGMLVDDITLPVQSVNYPYRTEVDVTLVVVGGLNQRADVGRDLDTLLEGAADPYATLRSSYLQSREAQIKAPQSLPDLPDLEDPGAGAAPAKPADAPAQAAPPTPADSPAAAAPTAASPEPAGRLPAPAAATNPAAAETPPDPPAPAPPPAA